MESDVGKPKPLHRLFIEYEGAGESFTVKICPAAPKRQGGVVRRRLRAEPTTRPSDPQRQLQDFTPNEASAASEPGFFYSSLRRSVLEAGGHEYPLAVQPRCLGTQSQGDQATLTRHSCGCPLEECGWNVHLSSVLSYEKLTAGGLTLHDADIVQVLEEVLPQSFGGVPTHYQLVEEDTDDGQPRLTLLVHPSVGPVDTEAVRQVFLDGIGGTGGVWTTPGFFQVERNAPVTTGTGKILHLHLGRTPR